VTRRWLIVGSRGQLGHALGQRLATRSGGGAEIVAAADLPELDAADPLAVAAWLDAQPGPAADFLVNAAAFTHVDRCEREPEAAARANAEAPGVLAAACAQRGIRLAHVSTDYVFAGDCETPYREDDEPDPRSAYGRTKLGGEWAVAAAAPDSLIVRTSWVFGRGRNFLAAVLDQAQARRRDDDPTPLRVVDDQRGRPTYAFDLAGAIIRLLESGRDGLFHVANDGVASWWELARACLDESGFADLSVERIRTDELDLDAPRPAWSVLDCSRLEATGIEMRSWREALAAYLHSAESPLAAAGAGVASGANTKLGTGSANA
jgi:dTDP-4-dehydrorhamnose reductase